MSAEFPTGTLPPEDDTIDYNTNPRARFVNENGSVRTNVKAIIEGLGRERAREELSKGGTRVRGLIKQNGQLTKDILKAILAAINSQHSCMGTNVTCKFDGFVEAILDSVFASASTTGSTAAVPTSSSVGVLFTTTSGDIIPGFQSMSAREKRSLMDFVNAPTTSGALTVTTLLLTSLYKNLQYNVTATMETVKQSAGNFETCSSDAVKEAMGSSNIINTKIYDLFTKNYCTKDTSSTVVGCMTKNVIRSSILYNKVQRIAAQRIGHSGDTEEPRFIPDEPNFEGKSSRQSYEAVRAKGTAYAETWSSQAFSPTQMASSFRENIPYVSMEGSGGTISDADASKLWTAVWNEYGSTLEKVQLMGTLLVKGTAVLTLQELDQMTALEIPTIRREMFAIDETSSYVPARYESWGELASDTLSEAIQIENYKVDTEFTDVLGEFQEIVNKCGRKLNTCRREMIGDTATVHLQISTMFRVSLAFLSVLSMLLMALMFFFGMRFTVRWLYNKARATFAVSKSKSEFGKSKRMLKVAKMWRQIIATSHCRE
jgi:hypothetical protein